MLGLALFDIRNGGIEPDFDGVFADFKSTLYIEFVSAEHVVSSGNVLGVNFYGSERIEPFAAEENLLVTEEFFLDIKCAFINPIYFTDPLEMVFVILVVRVGDFASCQQVAVNGAGYGRLESILLTVLLDCPFPAEV